MRMAVTLAVIAVTPTAVAAAAVLLPRAVRAVRRRLSPPPQVPAGPPLEQVAADLRRLLAEHVHLTRSPHLAARGRRLVALEQALTDRALDACRALDLPHPARPAGAALPTPALRQLLLELAASGVVLPGVERFGVERSGGSHD